MMTLPSHLLYCDMAATTPLSDAALQAMMPWLTGQFGNASSLHTLGQQARQGVEAARQSIQASLGVQAGKVRFTSGATESNNGVIRGVVDDWHQRHPETRPHVIISAIEHESVLEPCVQLQRQGRLELTILPVDSEGFVAVETLRQSLQSNTALVSIIWGNNEVGTLQDINKLGQCCRQAGVLFHTDAVQVVGKHDIQFDALPIDLMSWSAHKFYGPKGMGGLAIAEGVTLPSTQQAGGGQELAYRSGTENVAALAGMAKALAEATEQWTERRQQLVSLDAELRRLIEDGFSPWAQQLTWHFNGPVGAHQRVPGLVHVSLSPQSFMQQSECLQGECLQGEALVMRMNLKGVAVSSGSACHSAVIEPSRIVRALITGDAFHLQYKPEQLSLSEYARALGTVRISLSHSHTRKDLQKMADTLVWAVQGLLKKTVKRSVAETSA